MKRSRLTRSEGVALIKIGLAGVVTAPMYWLLTASDRWFLQHFHGAEAVGVYSIGYSVAIVGMMVNSAVIAVWTPEARAGIRRRPSAGASDSRQAHVAPGGDDGGHLACGGGRGRRHRSLAGQ